MELQLEELEAAASEGELAAGRAAAPHRHPARKPFPAHLPRERAVLEAPCACAACGSGHIVTLGEDAPRRLR